MRALLNNCLFSSVVAVIGMAAAAPASDAEAPMDSDAKESATKDRDQPRAPNCQGSASPILKKILRDNDCEPQYPQRQPNRGKVFSNKR